MKSRIFVNSILVIVVLLLSVQIAFAYFDDAEIIEVGDSVDFYCVNGKYIRMYVDDPNQEMNIYIQKIDQDLNMEYTLAVYNSNYEQIYNSNNFMTLSETEYGFITERGWYYILVKNVHSSSNIYHIKFNVFTTLQPSNPYKFKLSSMSIIPSNAYEGENIVTSFEVKNSGFVTDTCIVEFNIDDVLIDTKEVVINPNAIEKFTFNTIAKGEGKHDIKVKVYPIWSSSLTYSEINGIYTMLYTPQAKFEVSNLIITPEKVDINEKVSMTVDVTNIGEVDGTYDVKLYVDGIVKDSKQVTLSSSGTESVIFTIAEKYTGTYEVMIDDLSGLFIVSSPSPPLLHLLRLISMGMVK